MDHEKMVSELERDEGLRLKFYMDSKGIPTIGIGRNLKVGISREEAYYLLNHDLEAVEGDLDHTFKWWRGLDEVRQRVMANMCFNLGIAGLSNFVKFLGLAFAERFDEAAREMLDSDWARQVGPRAVRLADMMRKGDAYVAVVA